MKPRVNAGSLIHFGPRMGVSSSEAAPVSWPESSGMKDGPVMPSLEYDEVGEVGAWEWEMPKIIRDQNWLAQKNL